MNLLARYETFKTSNHPCPDLMAMAERELSAFFKTITRLFGSEQANISAADWLQEVIDVDGLPTSARDWRLITLNATTRLASRVNSQLTEPQIA
jgi:hypothetical protein